jgi:hypothetical protein
MAFVYHKVPEKMSGNIIYPLSTLRELHPDLYENRTERHKNQPKVLEDSIPRLACFWNDVLHFTALTPQKISEALNKFGYNIKVKYYEIEAEKLEPEKTIVFIRPKTVGTPVKFFNFIDYNSNEIDKLIILSETAIANYKETPSVNDFLLHYCGAPYILYKGSLNVEGLKIIEV